MSTLKSSTLFVLAIPIWTIALSGCNLVGGLVKIALPFAGLKVAYACIPEGTSVDTPGGMRSIESLEAGDTVTGYTGRPVRVLQKHSYMENPKTAFLRVTFPDGGMVDLCGNHRITGLPARQLVAGQTIAGRTVSHIGSRHGITKSYDLLTEDAGYQIHGIPVNSMIEEMHAAASGMRSVRQD